MTIYKGMDRNQRNRIIEERCRDYGIPPEYDADGNAHYVPDMEDKIQFYENCQNSVLKEAAGVALTEMMGDPDGDDSWTEVM